VLSDYASRCVASGLSSGEGLIFDVRAATDKRRLILEAEFAQVIKVLAREGNTETGAVLPARERPDRKSSTIIVGLAGAAARPAGFDVRDGGFLPTVDDKNSPA